jgi:hypothetical protein
MKWEQDLIRDIRTKDDAYNKKDVIIYDPSRYHGRIEVTDANRNSVKEYFLKVRDRCKAVMEIGVCRNGSSSFTHVFLNNKLDNTIYVGIDLDDKSFLNNTENNIHTIKGSSFDVEKNMEFFRSVGVEEFDFIFIDGDHSIMGVLNDWEYSRMLSKEGIVGFHDTSWHLGPREFVNNLNTEKWNVVPNTCPKDWGVGFAWQK